MPVTPDQNYMQIRAPHWKIIIMIARLDKKATHKGIVEHYFVCGVSFFLEVLAEGLWCNRKEETLRLAVYFYETHFFYVL